MTASKVCTKCGVEKPLSGYYKSGIGRLGRKSWCKECELRSAANWRRENLTRHKKLVKDRQIVVHAERVAFLLDYLLDHPCVDCREADPLVLEFDHVRGKKKFTVSSSSKPLQALVEEIEKCDVRCVNCHRRRTCKGRSTQKTKLLSLVPA